MKYIPKFYGSPEKFLDWLKTIERIFDYEEFDDRKRYKFAITRLREHAYDWYEDLQRSRRVEGKEPIKSWEKLKRYMKRRFLPPKPAMIEKLDPYIAALKEDMEKINKMVKEYVAMKAQQQQDEFVHEPNSISTVPISKEMNLVPKEQQQTPKEDTFVYNNPLYEEDNTQESNSPATQVMSLPMEEDAEKQETHEQAATSMASDEEPEEEEERELPITSLTNEEEGPRESAPLTLDNLNIQHTQTKLRASLFQEREDSTQGKHEDTQRKKQRSYKPRSNTAAFYLECMFVLLLITIVTSWNVHARSGLKLLIYDSRTNLFKKGSLMREHEQERQPWPSRGTAVCNQHALFPWPCIVSVLVNLKVS